MRIIKSRKEESSQSYQKEVSSKREEGCLVSSAGEVCES